MSKQQSVWVSRPIFPDIVDRLRPFVEVITESSDRNYDEADLKRRLAEVDGALLGLSHRVGATTVAGNKRLKVVANLGVGYNNLDVDALTAAGIVASNTPDVLTESVADYAWALLLAAARKVGAAERWLREGKWAAAQGTRFDEWLGLDVHGKTLGILGMGRIGQAIARRGAGFNTRVIYHNRSRLDEATEKACGAAYVDKSTLLRESDQLLLVLPYTAQSHHAIGAAELAAMKPSAILVNIARGGIVDEVALAAALREGRLAAAGLDVFEGEPAVHADLLSAPNAVLSPHIASASEETRRAMANLAVDNVLAVLGHGPLAGRPPTALNPEVLRGPTA